MEDKMICILAGYDDKTEEHLASIQNKLYENGFEGKQTKHLLQHMTLGTYKETEESKLADTTYSFLGSW